jgi:tetratricopeptide (TPR) repeat protein
MQVPKQPSSAEVHFNVGLELIQAGDNLSAIQSLGRAIKIQPNYFAAYYQLGILVRGLGDLKAAKAWFLLALRCTAVSDTVYVNLGSVCAALGQEDEAAGYLLQALASRSLDWAAYRTIGCSLSRLGKLEDAVEALRRSIDLAPSAEAWSELGVCQFQQCDPVAAEASYRRALQCDPEFAAAHSNLGLTLLLQGDYGEGFKELEWRLKAKQKDFYHIEGFQAPMWTGEPLEGKTILIHAEQGYGDTLQFLRYLPMVAARGARVLLVVQPALQRLVADYPGIAECIIIGERLPDIDLQCPLMSLPHVFGTTLASIPEVIPIRAKQQLNDLAGGIRPLQVGLVWAGNPKHLTDRNRTLRLKDFGALGEMSGTVAFVSLQCGAAVKQLSERCIPFPVRDACSTVTDFADTAEILAGLDLVISVDTSVAHLAGSMGKPVWVLLGAVPEWRWGLKGETTPWYPTMRLFRSEERGGWAAMLNGVAAQLREFGSRHRATKALQQ